MRTGNGCGPFSKVNNGGTGPGDFGGGTRVTHAEQVATARTMVASPPPLAPRRTGSLLMPLGVSGVLATVFLVTGLALQRGPFYAAIPGAPSVEAAEPPVRLSAAPSSPSAAGSARAPRSAAPALSVVPEVKSSAVPENVTGPVDSPPMRAARAELADAMKKGNTKRATVALKVVLALDVNSLADAEIRETTLQLAQTASLMPEPNPSEFFELLKGDGGPRGLDVLYELVANKGGARASVEAARALRDPAVVARGTPAFQIAWAFRQAESCEAKRPLLSRVADEGDHRALGLLVIAKQRCKRGGPSCCDFKGADVDQAFDKLKARLGN